MPEMRGNLVMTNLYVDPPAALLDLKTLSAEMRIPVAASR